MGAGNLERLTLGRLTENVTQEGKIPKGTVETANTVRRVHRWRQQYLLLNNAPIKLCSICWLDRVSKDKKGVRINSTPLNHNQAICSILCPAIWHRIVGDGPSRGLRAVDDLVQKAPLLIFSDHLNARILADDIAQGERSATGRYYRIY